MHPLRRQILRHALKKVRLLKKQGNPDAARLARLRIASEDKATIKPQLEKPDK